jgi:arabinogalactan oligomer/maltooligosaccharide transport system substrate-binding protein
MSRKIWILLSLLLIASMMLVACSTPPAATEAPVTITIWHQWDGAYLTAIQAVFTAYMAEHPNVTIVLDKPENVSDALKVAIPAGEGPDIIGWAIDQIGSQALVGNIVDLGTLGVTMDELNSTYEPAAVKGVVWQGKIWALPESQEGIALVYNTALASATDFPSDPMDFAGLLAKAEAFQAANPGKYLICNQGLGAADAFHVAPIYFGFGVPAYVDDQGVAYMNTPEALAAGNWITQFHAVAPAETSHEICKTMLIEGNAAAWWTGPWAIADIEAAGIDYGILPMGRPFVGIKSLMITSNAVDRGTAATALDILRYFTNAANETQVALTNKTIPANTAALNDPAVQALKSVAGFGVSLNLGVPAANTPYAGAQWGPVGDATLAIWTGAQTPEEALAAAQAAIDEAIAAMK